MRPEERNGQVDPFTEFYALKRPCKNCPFLKVGAIELKPGRLETIIENLIEDDQAAFLCHKLLDRTDDDDENRTSSNIASTEKACAGAAAYLTKAGRPSLGMRFAEKTGSIGPDHWQDAVEAVIDPK